MMSKRFTLSNANVSRLNTDSVSFLEQGKNINLHHSRKYCGPFVLMFPECSLDRKAREGSFDYFLFLDYFSEYVETWWVNYFVSGSYRLCPTRINHGNHGSFGFGKIYASWHTSRWANSCNSNYHIVWGVNWQGCCIRCLLRAAFYQKRHEVRILLQNCNKDSTTNSGKTNN